jgi:hypothetical protein
MTGGAEKNLAVGDGGRTEAILVQIVFGEHFKLRPGFDDGR